LTPAAACMTYLVLIILGFFWSFERSKPGAGEIVAVAQMTALCAVARLIFSFVPYFNPVIAIIMLCGIGLGCRKGFVIGAMTALVSNMFLGQGPWTLFQMVSWGMAGVLGGILSGLKIVSREKWGWRNYLTAPVLCGLFVIFVTGPVMDLSSYFLYGLDLKIALGGGFIFNVSLAVSTAITIVLLGKPFSSAQLRVKMQN